MKYCVTMFGKNKLAFIGLILLTWQGFSQKGTQSPYSAFGIGELNLGQYASFMSMGGVSTGSTDSTIVNINNPASYVYFSRNRPVFQMGVNGKFSSFQTTADSSSQSTFGLNQIALGLPIRENWGATFGLAPYSFTGYTISNYILNGADTTHQAVNEGSGAISKLFFGIGFRPLNSDSLHNVISKNDTIKVRRQHMLSLGVNANYLFGTSDRVRSYEYTYFDYAYNSRVIDALRIKDGSVDFGFNYQYIFRPSADSLMNGSVSIGATYAPAFKLRAYQDLLSYSYVGSFYGNEGNSVGGTSVVDTIENISDNVGAIYIPEQYKLGLEYRFGWAPSRKGERMLRLGLEANYQTWSTYYEEFGTSPTNSPFRDRLGIGFGMEYSPVTSNDPSISVLSRTNYRIGFNYTQTELSINGTNIDNYGMSFGLGIPLNINATNTNINLGASLGSMGTTDDGLIREKYIGVFFGISIMPERSDLWFTKRKYD